MKLNEDEILEIVEKVKSGEASLDELKEALGGDELYRVFNKKTVDSLLKIVIETGKAHNLVEDGNGFDILEGLLNNKIIGNVSHFYDISPDYIINLPEQERKNMANAIAGNWNDLSCSLQTLWSRGIMTENCTTNRNDNIPMINMLVNEENIDFINSIYNQQDITGWAFYNIFDQNHKGYFLVRLEGEDLYKYMAERKPLKTVKPKENMFTEALEESLDDVKFYKESGVQVDELGDLDVEIKREEEMLSRLKSRNKDDEDDGR